MNVICKFLKNIIRPGRVSKKKKRSIVYPPGSRMLRISEYVLSPKHRELLAESIIADYQKEYLAALYRRRGMVLLFTIRIRWWLSFAKSIVIDCVVINWLVTLIKKTISG